MVSRYIKVVNKLTTSYLINMAQKITNIPAQLTTSFCSMDSQVDTGVNVWAVTTNKVLEFYNPVISHVENANSDIF